MSNEPSTSDTTPAWGGPPAPDRQEQKPRRWPAARIAVAAAVALGIAGAGATVVYASTGSAGSTTGQEQGPSGDGGPMGGGPGGANLTDALHGEYVVSDGDGGYTTELMQTGEVTAISDTSVTATSDDGYTKTYTIDADTVLGANSDSNSSGDIAKGDEVTITASVSGDTATADSVSEAGQMGQPPAQN
jgi:hypothetical protein